MVVPKYVISSPVDTLEGTPFWEINDSEKNENLVQIRKDVPGAKYFIQCILSDLERQE